MGVGGPTSNASQSAAIPARQNPVDLQGQATSPPSQQPKPRNRVRPAIRHQEIPEPGFPYRHAPTSFDRSFTAHLLEDDYDLSASSAQAGIRTVQELLGHKDVSTTMIYTHVLNRGPAALRSPGDRLFVPDGNSVQTSAGSPPGEIGCRRPQPIPVRSNTPPARPGPLP